MLRNRRSQSSLCCLDLLDQLRHDLEQIAHDAVVSNAEDGSTLVLVDSDDALRILHTGGVLDSTRDTQSHIDLGVHSLAGLTDLMVSGHPACITKEKMTPRQLTIVSVALGVGYGMGANSGILAQAPQALQLICGESGIVPAAFVAILLNVLLPKDDKAV